MFLFPGNDLPYGSQEAFSHDVDLTQWHDYSFVQPPGQMHQTIQLDDFFAGGGLNTAHMQVDWVRMYDV